MACFSLQLLHHNVKFTACSLFTLDETLLYTVSSIKIPSLDTKMFFKIFGAAATYLVIVLQFEIGVGAD